MASYPNFPKSFGVIYFPGFEVLDIAGPLEALNCLTHFPGFEDLQLSIISRDLEPVSIGSGSNKFLTAQRYLPTHTFETAPQLDVLLLPGGVGAAPQPFPDGKDASHIQDYIDFVHNAYFGKNGRQPLKYILRICNGSTFLALAGILDGQKATTNKHFWKESIIHGPKTHWVANARWVSSGNIWTTSGVSAGADGTLAWMSSLLPEEVVGRVVDGMEWIRAKNAEHDPFSANLEDSLPKSS